MHHEVESGSASNVRAPSLGSQIFTVTAATAVLGCSVYSFGAVGRGFAEQPCTPLYLSGKIDSRGRPSSEDLSYAGISICMKHETPGAASEMWGDDGFQLQNPWHVHP